MLDQRYLQELAKKLKIAPMNIVRESVEVELLQTLTESDLTKNLLFYGGTAIRLAYSSPRFSEDLDFLMTRRISSADLERVLEKFCAGYIGSSVRDVKDKRQTLFALVNVTHPALKHPINVKIEMSKKRDGLTTALMPLSSPCSHLTPIVPVPTIQMMLTLKENAIKGRDEPRDWFDLWFITKYMKQDFSPPEEFPFAPHEFKRELKRFLPQDKWTIIDQILKEVEE